MKNQQVNIIFAALILCVAAYVLLIIIKDISSIYQGWATFFDQKGSIYPIVITSIIAFTPVSVVIIAYLVYSNKRTYFILLLVVHVILLFSNYVVYGMVVLLLIWWFSKYAIKAT